MGRANSTSNGGLLTRTGRSESKIVWFLKIAPFVALGTATSGDLGVEIELFMIFGAAAIVIRFVWSGDFDSNGDTIGDFLPTGTVTKIGSLLRRSCNAIWSIVEFAFFSMNKFELD